MKFGQLIEYNMRTPLLKNHTQNVVEKLFPDRFLRNQNHISESILLMLYTVCFYCMLI